MITRPPWNNGLVGLRLFNRHVVLFLSSANFHPLRLKFGSIEMFFSDKSSPRPQFEALTPCPLCGGLLALPVCNVDGKTGEPLRTIMCMDCGLGRIDPLPDRIALEAWYREAYRQEYKSSVQPKMRHVLRAGRNARDRWSWLRSHANLPEGFCRTLDVGSSSGEFVFLMKRLGYQATGIEPHTGYAAYARDLLDLDILEGSLYDQKDHLPAQSMHLVTMFHVLEHVVSPIETLAAFRRLLTPKGLLLIEVPGSTRLCGHATLFFKAHSLHFTAVTLKSVVERAGFDVLALEAPHDGNITLLARPSALQGGEQQVLHQCPDDSIWRAAQLRTPWRYGLNQLMTAAPLRKLAKNIEERQKAKSFVSAKDCLNSLYSELK